MFSVIALPPYCFPQDGTSVHSSQWAVRVSVAPRLCQHVVLSEDKTTVNIESPQCISLVAGSWTFQSRLLWLLSDIFKEPGFVVTLSNFYS